MFVLSFLMRLEESDLAHHIMKGNEKRPISEDLRINMFFLLV